MSAHSLTAELIALRNGATTPFEQALVTIVAKLYGLISALQLVNRLQNEQEQD